MNKQSQANHSTVNPPQKRAARQATDASSASAFERAPGRALRGGRAGVIRPRATSHVGRSRGTRLPTPRLHVLRGRGFRLSGTEVSSSACVSFFYFLRSCQRFSGVTGPLHRAPPPCVCERPAPRGPRRPLHVAAAHCGSSALARRRFCRGSWCWAPSVSSSAST